jgi:micrococcal nuclease
MTSTQSHLYPSVSTFKVYYSAFFVALLSLLISSSPSQSYSSTAPTETFTGQVIDVADGDTITVSRDGVQEKIRLSAVDCPESTQEHGQEAKRYTESMVKGKRVRINPETKDQYGRTVAMVLINGVNLNEQIVANGHGWVFRKYCKEAYCGDWLRIEEKAKSAGKGLWAKANPQAPWDYRAENRGSNGRPAALPGGTGEYHGNVKSKVFHGPSCKDYNCKNCTVVLGSVGEALSKGFRAHNKCVGN